MTKEDRRITSHRSDDRVEQIRHNANKILSAVKFLIFICFVLAVLLVGNFLRSYVVQDDVDKVRDIIERTEKVSIETAETANGAKTAADNALAELRQAIKSIQEANADEPDLNNQAIIDALQAIARLEGYMCGGPCPAKGS